MGLSRNLDTQLLSALSGTFNPITLVFVDWPSSPVYTHSGIGDVSFNGQTWLGLGKYGGISIPSEDLSLVNTKATLSVAGNLVDLLAELNADPRNSDVLIYFGVTTEPAGNVLVGEPTLIFSGYVDSVDFSLNKQGTDLNSSLTVGISSGPSARASATINHTPEDQVFKYPNDTAGRQLVNQNKKLYNPDVWPEA